MIQSLLPLRGRTKLEVEGMFALKNEASPGLCVVRGCRKKHIPEARGGKLHLCCRHYMQRWRSRNPKQAAFATLRDHARLRRIKFTLTFAHFVEITDAAGFWNQTAEDFKDYLSIDRILAAKGYEDGNLQVITVSENSAKSAKERYLPLEIQELLARRRAREKELIPWHMEDSFDSDMPF